MTERKRVSKSKTTTPLTAKQLLANVRAALAEMADDEREWFDRAYCATSPTCTTALSLLSFANNSLVKELDKTKSKIGGRPRGENSLQTLQVIWAARRNLSNRPAKSYGQIALDLEALGLRQEQSGEPHTYESVQALAAKHGLSKPSTRRPK